MTGTSGARAECGACHNARDWSVWDFDHGRRTRYALDGAHARVACASCHNAPAAPGKTLPAGRDAVRRLSSCG